MTVRAIVFDLACGQLTAVAAWRGWPPSYFTKPDLMRHALRDDGILQEGPLL